MEWNALDGCGWDGKDDVNGDSRHPQRYEDWHAGNGIKGNREL